jgi:hypothetical protein
MRSTAMGTCSASFFEELVARPDAAWLEVRKRGHGARKIRVTLDRDVTWDVVLPRLDP